MALQDPVYQKRLVQRCTWEMDDRTICGKRASVVYVWGTAEDVIRYPRCPQHDTNLAQARAVEDGYLRVVAA